ncbi:MAG: carbon-nitrogen hydrolase family protein [Candidatus Saccharimonadales bacterium]
MKRIIAVAAVQMHVKPLDINTNLAKAEALITKACHEQKLDLVVLPEDFLTGPIGCNLDMALSLNSAPIKRLQQLALEFKLYLAAGSFIQKISDNYYNTALLIDPAGEVILEYRKNKPWLPERRYLTPGNTLPVVKTPIGTIGLLVCWDLADPLLSQKLAAKGANIICCPSYWTFEDSNRLDKKYPAAKSSQITMVNTLCSARAIENEVLFIYANGALEASIPLKSKVLHHTQIGQTQICTPLHGTAKRLHNNAEGFITCSYDHAIAKDVEKVYKLRLDLGEN